MKRKQTQTQEQPVRIEPADLAHIEIPSVRRDSDGKLLWEKPGGENEERDEFPKLVLLGDLVFEFREERVVGPDDSEEDVMGYTFVMGYYSWIG